MYSGCIRKSISGTNYLQKLSTTNMPEIINTKIQNILYRHAKEIRDKSVSHVCILEESIKLCKENNEHDKYLMTFQNLVSRIPKWNTQIIETERKRICEKSGCMYLEELITCVHIIKRPSKLLLKMDSWFSNEIFYFF